MLKSRRTLIRITALSGLLVALLLGLSAKPALAGKPIFDSGTQLDTNTPYNNAQTIDDIWTDRAVYGKLEGSTPIDIYKYTSDRDGEQTVSLLSKHSNRSEAQPTPLVIFVDSTTATTDQQVGVPVPDSSYHTAVLTASDAGNTYYEPALLEQFNQTALQKIHFTKGKTYYFIVLDPNRLTTDYALRFGTNKAWQFTDIFRHMGSWLRIKSDSFAGTSPYFFNVDVFGLAFLLLGFLILAGSLFVQETYAFLANRSKAAGYVLIKMQPYSKVFIWISLWFMAIGGYIYFDRIGWDGLPFILTLLFVVIVLNMVYVTFSLSRKVAALEVSKKEATIPFALRKRWFFSSLISLFSVGAFLVYLAQYLTK